MRGARVKASRRQLVQANAKLARAVDHNADVATGLLADVWSYVFQSFWQSVAIAALLTYMQRVDEHGDFTDVERAVTCWPANVEI